MAPAVKFLTQLKVQLKLSISRLRMMQQKDDTAAKQLRRAMALLLQQGKYESARIRTENLIRSDLTSELHETLELYCELLLARIQMLESATCDPGLEEAVKSIIYAAPRTDAKELQAVRSLLVDKYGKAFTVEVMDKKDGVSKRVLDKMRAEPPSSKLVERYLEAIADGYGVDYPPGKMAEEERRKTMELEKLAASLPDGGGDEGTADDSGAGDEPSSTAAELHKATPPRNFGPGSPVSIAPPKPSTDNAKPSLKLPGTPELKPSARVAKNESTASAATPAAAKTKPDGDVPDVNDLEKRFAMLKR